MDTALRDGRLLIEAYREAHDALYAYTHVPSFLTMTGAEKVSAALQVESSHSTLCSTLRNDLQAIGYETLDDFFAANLTYCENATEEEAQELDTLWT